MTQLTIDDCFLGKEMEENGISLEVAWTEYFGQLSGLVDAIKDRDSSEDRLEKLHRRICAAMQSINQIFLCTGTTRQELEEVVQNFVVFDQMICRELRGATGEGLAIYQLDETNTVHHQGPGRPKYNISEETLIGFRSLGFTWKEISTMLMVSRWTIHRRVKVRWINPVVFENITDFPFFAGKLGFLL